MAETNAKIDKPSGFFNEIQANGQEVLKYRPKDGGKLERTLPAPQFGPYVRVHPETGSIHDSRFQTATLTDYATDEDLNKEAAPMGPPPGPAGEDNAVKNPPA